MLALPEFHISPQSQGLHPVVIWGFACIYPVMLAVSLACDFLLEVRSTLHQPTCAAAAVLRPPEALQPALVLVLFGAVLAKIGSSHPQKHPSALPLDSTIAQAAAGHGTVGLQPPPHHASSSSSSSDDEESAVSEVDSAAPAQPPACVHSDRRVQLLGRLAARAGGSSSAPPLTEAHMDLADALLSRPLQSALRELSMPSDPDLSGGSLPRAATPPPPPLQQQQPPPLQKHHHEAVEQHRHRNGVRKFNHALRSISSSSCPDVAALAAAAARPPPSALEQPPLHPHSQQQVHEGGAPAFQLPSLPFSSLSQRMGVEGAPTLLSAAGVPSAFLFAPRPMAQAQARGMRLSASSTALLPMHPMPASPPAVALPGQRVQRPVPLAATPPALPAHASPPIPEHTLADLAYAVVHAAHTSKRMAALRQVQAGQTLLLSGLVAAVPTLTRLWHGTSTLHVSAAHNVAQALWRPGVLLAWAWQCVQQCLVQPQQLGGGGVLSAVWGAVGAHAPALAATWCAAHCAIALLQYIFQVAVMRHMIAKRFGSLTSPLAARKAALPHVPLAAPAHVVQWLALRGLLRRRGSLRGIDAGIRHLVFLTLACLFLLMFLVNDVDESPVPGGVGGEGAVSPLHHAVLFNALAAWTLVLCVYVSRFVALSDGTARKFRSTSVLQVAQVNAHAVAAAQPAGGDKASTARLLGLLKAAEALLKELEQPGRLTGVKLSPALYSAVRIAALSAVSALVAKVLGFNVRLWKSLATKGG